MAYFRGNPYIFDGGDYLHIWVREHYTPYRTAGWIDGGDPDAASGVQVPSEIFDRLALMRLAEMLVEKRAVSELDAFLGELGGVGNTGSTQLLGNAKVLREGLAALEARCRHTTVEDLGW